MVVLVVEDDETLGDMLRRGLEAKGFRVQWVRDGDAAYDRACTGTHDLIVLDLMLPGLDGLAVLRALREAGVRTPVLCLTARGSVEDRVTGLEAGADDYLSKPFAFEELLARLRALLRRPAHLAGPDELVVGTLRLAPLERRVTVGDRPVSLPGREFELLEYLMRNADRVLPRDLIAERVWGSGDTPRSNVVDVTVWRLRRRLAEAGWEGAILPVPGVGYTLSSASRTSLR